jgi:hypothetical protein
VALLRIHVFWYVTLCHRATVSPTFRRNVVPSPSRASPTVHSKSRETLAWPHDVHPRRPKSSPSFPFDFRATHVKPWKETWRGNVNVISAVHTLMEAIKKQHKSISNINMQAICNIHNTNFIIYAYTSRPRFSIRYSIRAQCTFRYPGRASFRNYAVTLR